MSRPVQGDGGEPAGGRFAKWSWTPGPPGVQLKVADSGCPAPRGKADDGHLNLPGGGHAELPGGGQRDVRRSSSGRCCSFRSSAG